MDDYLTRVAEAVRDACAAEAFMETTLAAEYVSAACPGEIISNMILNNIDLQAVIASVPRPEPVFYVLIDGEETQFNGKNAFSRGRTGGQPLYAEPVAAQLVQPGEIDCSDAPCMPADMEPDLAYRDGWNACRDAMLADETLAPQQDDEIATLRVDAERYRWLRDRCRIVEYAAAFGGINVILPSGDRLDAAIDRAKGGAALAAAPKVPHTADDAATLREQNAALVAALEGVLQWIDDWAETGPGFERVEAAADAALASAKGGAA